MPPPTWNFTPRRHDGQIQKGFDRRSPYQMMYEDLQPSLYPQWSPPSAIPTGGVVGVNEVGGGMLRRPGMQNMGDFFTYPEAQGVTPMQFIDQSVAAGMSVAPPPPWAVQPLVQPDIMDETHLYNGGGRRQNEGSMAWESNSIAPWDMEHPPGWSGPAAAPPLGPGEVEPRVAQMQARQIDAQQKKSIEAAQAAKVASDNAMRAAVAGAPTIAATNAATAQAAANVAAGIARTPAAQRAAAVAQTEATKAVAAANVAAANALRKGAPQQGSRNGPRNGMGDWMELSGLDSSIAGGFQVKHALAIAAGGAFAFFGYRWLKNRK